MGLENRAVQPASKHPLVVRLLDALALSERGWVVVEHWDADDCAVGIARRGAPRRLVYVSVGDLAPGRYYFECEAPSGPDPTDYEIIDKGEDVDFETLSAVMERHLSVDR